MKYREIKLENNKSVLVDESAEIKGLYHDSFTNKLYQSNGADYVKSAQVNNVVATINHSISLNVPMVIVEDEVEKVCELEYNKHPNNEILYGNDKYKILAYKAGVFDGFKAAQEKGVFSDLITKQINDFRHDLRESTSNYVKQNCEGAIFGLNRLLQSLKQEEYIELEMESGYIDGSVGDDRIKTTQDSNGQLMAYLKQ